MEKSEYKQLYLDFEEFYKLFIREHQVFFKLDKELIRKLWEKECKKNQ